MFRLLAMPTIEQETAKRRQILEKVSPLAKDDYKKLYRTDELGKLGFESGAAAFERTFTLLRALNVDALAAVPWPVLERIDRYVDEVKNTVERIRGFQVTNSGNPINDRNAYIGQLDALYKDLFQEAPTAILVLLSTSDDRRKAADLVTKAQVDFEALLQGMKEQLETRVKEAEQLVDKMRSLSGQVALQKYAKFFEDEANNARKAAYKWLAATTIVGCAITISLVLVVLVWSPTDKTPTQLVQAGGAKLALFSVVFYLLSWCGRNFKAQWHTNIVNRHRANTLNAMEAFANSASKAEVREAILIHASSAIFSQVTTGFIPDAADGPSNPTILEIVRGTKQ